MKTCATIIAVRYLVTAKVKPGKVEALERAIEDGTLGTGSIAGDEYLRNMGEARELEDGRVQWVEVCYCWTPLAEERPYWEKYFALLKVQDAHARSPHGNKGASLPFALNILKTQRRKRISRELR